MQRVGDIPGEPNGREHYEDDADEGHAEENTIRVRTWATDDEVLASLPGYRPNMKGHGRMIKEAARLMSLMTMIFTVAPVVAPTIGALLVAQWGWRAPFLIIVALGVLKNGRITEQEIESIARMRNVAGDVLRQIGQKRDWIKSYSIVSALVCGGRGRPSTPRSILVLPSIWP